MYRNEAWYILGVECYRTSAEYKYAAVRSLDREDMKVQQFCRTMRGASPIDLSAVQRANDGFYKKSSSQLNKKI